MLPPQRALCSSELPAGRGEAPNIQAVRAPYEQPRPPLHVPPVRACPTITSNDRPSACRHCYHQALDNRSTSASTPSPQTSGPSDSLSSSSPSGSTPTRLRSSPPLSPSSKPSSTTSRQPCPNTTLLRLKTSLLNGTSPYFLQSIYSFPFRPILPFLTATAADLSCPLADRSTQSSQRTDSTVDLLRAPQASLPRQRRRTRGRHGRLGRVQSSQTESEGRSPRARGQPRAESLSPLSHFTSSLPTSPLPLASNPSSSLL
jgi:hypothetical protein